MRNAEITPGPTRQHRLEAVLLGGLAMRYDGRPLPETAFRRRKGQMLLLRLLAVPGHRLPTEVALEWLWPDHDPEAGAHRLRTLHALAEVARSAGAAAAVAQADAEHAAIVRGIGPETRRLTWAQAV